MICWSEGLPRCAGAEEPARNAGGVQRRVFDPWVRKIPWRRKWQPPPVLWPGVSHGQRSLVGCGPGGRKESDMTEAT